LKTLDAFALLVLSSVLLEVKQKFKHGGVDNCPICMSSFELIFGINVHYFVIYALFLLLRLVSTYMGFGYRF